jgi:hypothetical protein
LTAAPVGVLEGAAAVRSPEIREVLMFCSEISVQNVRS